MLLARPLPSLGYPRYLADRSWAGSTGISPTGVAWRTPERGSGVGAGEIPALRNAPTARAVASQPAGLGDRLAPRESTPVVLLARSAARPGSPAGAGDGSSAEPSSRSGLILGPSGELPANIPTAQRA